MHLSLEHVLGIIIVFAATIIPGIIISRRIKSAEDYNVGGRKAGSFMVAGSIIATIIGGAATVGTAQLGFKLGLTAWWFTLGSGIALIIMAAFYAKPLRSSSMITIGDFFIKNYGRHAGTLASVLASAGIFFSIVASTLTALHLVSGVFGISLQFSGVLIIGSALALVLFGGISGSGIAGLVKILFIFATVFVGGISAYDELGRYQGIAATFGTYPWLSLFGNGLQNGIFNLLAMIVGVISTQSYAQAVFSAKDSKTASVGCILAALIVIPVGLPSVFIGMYMRAMHPEIDAIDALPLYLMYYLPDWLGGMGIAAVMLSSIGSIAGLSLGIGTMITKDFVKNIWHTSNERSLLLVNRICILFIASVAMVFVFYHLDSSVLGWNYLSMALRGSGVFLPLTFAIFFTNRIHKLFGFLAILSGIIIACLWNLQSYWKINSLFPALAGNLLFLLLGIIYEKYRRKRSTAKDNLMK